MLTIVDYIREKVIALFDQKAFHSLHDKQILEKHFHPLHFGMEFIAFFYQNLP